MLLLLRQKLPTLQTVGPDVQRFVELLLEPHPLRVLCVRPGTVHVDDGEVAGGGAVPGHHGAALAVQTAQLLAAELRPQLRDTGLRTTRQPSLSLQLK